ncbi:MAG: hypothetical protein ABSA92_12880 [Candidatus Bathyarchaeia archaeon]
MLCLHRDIEERISKLGPSKIDKNRKPFYRYTHRGFDIVENNAWRSFVKMQLTTLEIAEIRSIHEKRRQLGYASLVQPSDPKKATQDEELFKRYEALLEVAELRAEEHEETQWHSWLRYFQTYVWPEMQKPIQDEVQDDEREDYIWDFDLRMWDAWKATQGDES